MRDTDQERGRPSLQEALLLASSYDPARERRGRPVLAAAACTLVGVLLFAVNLALELRVRGGEATLVGFVLAVVPAPIYLLLFLWVDRYDPEPAWALALAFAWGALPAGLAATFLNDWLLASAVPRIGPDAAFLLASVLWTPLVEEAAKGLGLVLLLLLLRRQLDTVLDGVVYGGVIGLGFATAENVDYYAHGFLRHGGPALLSMALLRGVMKPFSHSFYTALTGIGCGISRETPRGARRLWAPAAGFLSATALHALHNLIAGMGDQIYILGYAVIMAPLFLLFLGVIAFLSDRERRIASDMLALEVARGHLPGEDQALARSRLARLRWLAAALPSLTRLRARRRYLHTLARLGFCHWHVERAATARSATLSSGRIPELRRELLALRARL